MSHKRNLELVELVNNDVLNNINVSEESKSIVSRLLSSYENNTYKEWDDRHEFYRETIGDMINDCGFRDKELAKSLANDHPTLQQNFMRLCVKFIHEMAEKTYYDGRNEASVKLAKKICETIEDEHLPFV